MLYQLSYPPVQSNSRAGLRLCELAQAACRNWGPQQLRHEPAEYHRTAKVKNPTAGQGFVSGAGAQKPQ
jgi:hypothetical protein